MFRGRIAQSGDRKPNRKGRSMAFFLDLLYSGLITLISFAALLWVGAKLFDYVRAQWQPAREISVGAFTTAGVALPADAGTVAQTLGSKLERLRRYARRDPSGFGLIQTPMLISIPAQEKKRQSEASQRLESVNLRVQEVQVNEVIKFLQALLAPARVTLEGTVTDYGDTLEIRSELLWKNRVIDGWVASRRKPAQADAAKIGQTLNDLYDDLLFQMMYDIPHNAKLHWKVDAEGASETPNWQTLEAMTLGLESLDAYQRTLDYEDLKRSLGYLEEIPIHAPGYALGHYFLGVALGEDRQEERAVSVFSDVVRMTSDPDLKWAAQFQRAAAMLREYDGQPAADAARLLEELIQELKTAKNGKDERAKFAARLLPLAEAQRCYTYGTLLTLKTTIPESDLKKSAEEAWKDADYEFNAVNEEDWTSEQEKREVRSWLFNTKGYASFRIAQWELAQGGKSQEELDKYTRACEDALQLLQGADQERPNSYEVLQNEAMILDDERFDPEDKRIDEALSFYERTVQFVPRDYYQYERLARIYWRKARKQPTETLQSDLVQKGNGYVQTALSYRPNSRTAASCGAYFAALAANKTADALEKTKQIQDAIAKAKLALRLGGRERPGTLPILADAAKLMDAVAATLDDKDKSRNELKGLARQIEHP